MTIAISRVAIGPVEVSGIGESLAIGFTELGLESYTTMREEHRFGYGSVGPRSVVISFWQRQFSMWRASARRPMRRRIHSIITEFAAWLVVFKLARPGTAVVIMFGASFTRCPELELRLLRRAGARIVFLNLGSDLRPPYMDGPALASASAIADLATMTSRRQRLARRQERFGHLVIAAPSCGQFLRHPFITWFVIGIPQNLTEQSRPESDSPERIRVLHAPSDPTVKGTDLVRRAVQECKTRGAQIEYVELSNVTNAQVVEEIRRSDLLIDQAYSDLPMAGFGAEGAANGVASVVAGYYSGSAAAGIPPDLHPPSSFVEPEFLADALMVLTTDPSARVQLARNAEEFLRSTWTPRRSAERLLRCLEGPIPHSWTVDPRSISYFLGCGASRERVLSATRDLVEEAGVQALGLTDKPQLQARILRAISL